VRLTFQEGDVMKKKTEVARKRPDNAQGMKRRFTRDGTRCLVTFRLPREAAPDATSVAVAGSFNDWSVDRHPLKRLKNGDFSLALELEAGRDYEFRFLIDGVRWENAWNADKYVWCDHAQCENSVVVV
jgi:1,4-alpha-glucan branching enzyme